MYVTLRNANQGYSEGRTKYCERGGQFCGPRRTWCSSLLNAGAFPAIFKLCGFHSYLAAQRDSWQLIDELRQGWGSLYGQFSAIMLSLAWSKLT